MTEDVIREMEGIGWGFVRSVSVVRFGYLALVFRKYNEKYVPKYATAILSRKGQLVEFLEIFDEIDVTESEPDYLTLHKK